VRLIVAGLTMSAAAAVAQVPPAPSEPPPAPSSVSPSAQGDVSLTIYNGDVALVQDVRQLAIRQGRVPQVFPDVSAQIRPETVSLSVPDATVVEQNFDYDLLSPTSLMQKAVGETITIVRTNPGTGAETRQRARVLAANGGVVMEVNGQVEVLRDDGLPTRAVFDRVPPTLRARPTLTVTLDSTRGGTRPATLSYLSRGLGWKADYVALLDRQSGRADVQGWVTLTNTSGTTYNQARTLLVAGEVGQGDDDGNNFDRQRWRGPAMPTVRGAGTETSAREQLGDFYLYPLPGRTDVADKQTKQVSFLEAKGVQAMSGYQYLNPWLGTAEEPRSAASVLRFRNSAAGGLGDALPAGTVRVYVRDARGQPQFTGENQIPHTPQGSEIALATGDAFDVKVRPVVESRTKLGDARWRTAMRYDLSNAGRQGVTVELVQAGLDWADTRVTAQSREGRREDAGRISWQVPVPANGRATVTATFDTRY